MPVRTPWFPTYGVVRALLPILEGVPKQDLTRLISSVMAETGTPQATVDWTNPDEWIPSRLSAEQASLALRIWTESKRGVNPRYLRGPLSLITNYDLVESDERGRLRITDRGRDFMRPGSATESEVDEAEGLSRILGSIRVRGSAKKSDLLPEWKEFLLGNSTYRADTVVSDFLFRRLKNLVERGLLSRSGNDYIPAGGSQSTMPGEATVAAHPLLTDAPSAGDPIDTALRAVKEYNDGQRSLIIERMRTLTPSQFEELVKELLQAMDYEDVRVVGQSGDMGVDVVAFYKFGITRSKEVVQVKHHARNVQRHTVDQLRGALPYHGAIRGTIVALEGFAKGCTDAAVHVGGAPITLIDGEALADLLMTHGVGVDVREAKLLRFNSRFFDALGQPGTTEGDE